MFQVRTLTNRKAGCMKMFLMVVTVAALGVAGDVLVNQWAKTHLVRWWLLSLPVWVVTATVFGVVLREKHYSFGITVVVILLIHSGLVLAWDTLIERAILTPMQWAGVAAAIAAIVLMEGGRK
ncbi:MAG: hypothetical protein UW83_C0037G0001 [Parcubacteria group bacterium GW2011_GWD1_44_9]|nr:MAG: hypothetical protein UW83_C0037G0001 [Parcubacteria group bacterium GW2011_GWD1_44_9]